MLAVIFHGCAHEVCQAGADALVEGAELGVVGVKAAQPAVYLRRSGVEMLDPGVVSGDGILDLGVAGVAIRQIR